MKYDNPRARRYALRGVSPWFLLVFAAIEGGLSAWIGWTPLPAVATAAAVLSAAFLLHSRYDLVVMQERFEVEKSETEARMAKLDAEVKKTIALMNEVGYLR